MVLKVNGAIQIQYKAIGLLRSDEKSKWPQQIAHWHYFDYFKFYEFWKCIFFLNKHISLNNDVDNYVWPISTLYPENI